MQQQTVRHNLEILIRARYPYIYIQTWEEARVIGTIREMMQNQLADSSIRRSRTSGR